MISSPICQTVSFLMIGLNSLLQIQKDMMRVLHFYLSIWITLKRSMIPCVRIENSLSRLGGDEFTVILQNIKTPTAAAEVAQKLLDIINTKLIVNNHEIYISASIGISAYPKDLLLRKVDLSSTWTIML